MTAIPHEPSAREALEAYAARVRSRRAEALGLLDQGRRDGDEALGRDGFEAHRRAADECRRVRALPYWWCKGCGERFRRVVPGQTSCCACLGWHEQRVTCRHCRRPFVTTMRRGCTRHVCYTCRKGVRRA